MLKRVFIGAFILAMAIISHAQDGFYVDVSTSRPDPAVGENVQVEYALKFKGRNLNLQHSGIQIKKPSMGSFQIVDEYPNNAMDFGFGSSDITIYKYIFVLKPTKEGKQTIAPLKFIMNGKEYSSGELTLSVRKGGTAPSSTQSTEKSNTPSSSQLFARMLVSKSNPYKGEGIIITHKIYSSVDLASLGDVKFPSFSGFWSQEVPSTEVKLSNESLNGVNYRVVELKQHVLFPQQNGRLTIAPLQVECIVQEIKERPARDRMEQMFYGNVIRYRENVTYDIQSKSVTIDVRDLPATGRPASFSGMAGKLGLEATIDKDHVETNEAVTLRYTIKGQGNIDLIPEPNFNFPPDFERYDPKLITNSKASAGGVNGSKTYEYLLIPRKAGSFELDPVDFTYFDLTQGAYVTLSTPLFRIEVEKGEGIDRQVSVSGTTQEDVQYIGQDIRYIKTGDLGLGLNPWRFAGSHWFWLLFLVPIFLILALVIYRRTPAKPMMKKAYQKARKEILAAKRADPGQFYEALSQALYRYCANRLKLPYSGLTVEAIEISLKSQGIDEAIVHSLLSLIEESEFMRFAPSMSSDAPQDMVDRVINVLENIERELR